MSTLHTDTVITREVEWLSTTNDSLPALIKSDMQDGSAPFDVIAGYWPRQPGNVRAVYVTRNTAMVMPWSTGRELSRHAIRLRVWWPILSGDVQQVQADLDAALDLVLQRVAGPQWDKTHGGRFMSAAEVRTSNNGITVTFSDPERLGNDGALRADLTYLIDDTELNL